MQRALKAGASGYLLKNTPPSEVLQAIRKVHSGQKVVRAELAAKLAEHIDVACRPVSEAKVVTFVHFAGVQFFLQDELGKLAGGKQR